MSSDPSFDQEQPFISHLVELRDRLLRAILVVFVLFSGMAFYSNEIYAFLAGPLLKHMPSGSQMIAIEVASPFLTPFKLTLVAAVFLAAPYILYQAWAFVAPGLYRHERRLVFPLLVSSSILFYAGIAFAYYVVFPVLFAFITTTAPAGVTVMTDISKYLDFVLTIFFAFGISFEVPIFTILLVWTGIISRKSLVDKRPYMIVLAFVVGAVLTPPDPVSQSMLAIPIWMLFELGLFFSRFFEHSEEEEKSHEMLADPAGQIAHNVEKPADGHD